MAEFDVLRLNGNNVLRTSFLMAAGLQLDGTARMSILRRMKRIFPWIALGILAVSCSSCALAQLAGRTAGNTVKGVSQAASAASAAL